MYNKNKTPSHKVYLSSLGKRKKELTKEELKHYRKLYYLDNKERIAAKYTPVSNRSDISLKKKAFRESLGKKVKDFTIEERRTYNKIGYHDSYEKRKQYYDKNISQIRNRSRKNYHEGEGKEKAKQVTSLYWLFRHGDATTRKGIDLSISEYSPLNFMILIPIYEIAHYLVLLVAFAPHVEFAPCTEHLEFNLEFCIHSKS